MIGGAAFVQTLFWTWFFCLRYTTALEFDFRECAAMVGVSFAVAIGMALRSRVGGGAYAQRVGVVACGASLATAGTAAKTGLMLLTLDPLVREVVRLLACACIGASMSVLFIVAMECLSGLGIRSVGKALSLTLLGVAGLSAALSSLPVGPFALAASVLPVLMGVALIARRAFGRKSPLGASVRETPPLAREKLVVPVRPMIMMAAAEFAGCFATFPFADERTSSLSLALGCACVSLVFLVGCFALADRFDVRMLYQVSLPLMAGGLLLGPLLSQQAQIVSCAFVNAGVLGFLLLSVMVLNENCRCHGVPSAWAYGFLRCALLPSQLVGAWLVFAVGEGLFDWMKVEALYSISMLLIVVSSMTFLNEYNFIRSWRLSREEPVGTCSQDALNSQVARCALLARAFGLRRREEEVVALVAQGRTVPQAADELFISRETAKTHMKHAYAKLGIHTKGELLDRVYGQGSAGSVGHGAEVSEDGAGSR